MIEVKPLQPLKADDPIQVTPSGIVIEVKPLQPRKANDSIDFTLSGIVTEVKPLQARKYPIIVTGYFFCSLEYIESGITIFPDAPVPLQTAYP